MEPQAFLASYQFLGANGAQGFGNSEVTLQLDGKGLPYLETIQAAETRLAHEQGVEPGKLIITNLVAISNERY